MRQLRRALLDGALVVLPLGALALLVIGIVARLRDAADPLSSQFVHPLVGAVALLVVLCLAVGLLVRSAMGAALRRNADRLLFERIPGYRLAKAMLGEGLTAEEGRRPRPALASIEEGECPALVMDELADGRLVVFVPGSPGAMSGAVYLFTADRVRVLDVPLMPFLRCVASWGLGLRELLQNAEAARATVVPVGGGQR
ncbi:hypothetical protein [Falsiroseomonas bella]|uniref:hypothetical protein n=1 Tax=Falsiroseomonas bella TaxID=2184016 RepID=UPI001304F56A|nr:hypothetical protein [Falsiroseomonas bella]